MFPPLLREGYGQFLTGSFLSFAPTGAGTVGFADSCAKPQWLYCCASGTCTATGGEYPCPGISCVTITGAANKNTHRTEYNQPHFVSNASLSVTTHFALTHTPLLDKARYIVATDQEEDETYFQRHQNDNIHREAATRSGNYRTDFSDSWKHTTTKHIVSLDPSWRWCASHTLNVFASPQVQTRS